MGDDETVPTGRAGIDPLIAYPLEASGQTGQIERPGDHTPWWFIPGMAAVAFIFIGLLLYVDGRNDDRVERAASPATAVADAPATSPLVADSGMQQGSAASTSPDPSVAPDLVPANSEATTEPILAGLADPGQVRIDTAGDFTITAACEVHLPFDPVDTEFQVSSYVFFDDAGQRALVERISQNGALSAVWNAADGPIAAGTTTDVGDAGAFSATFVGTDGVEFVVAVNPSSADGDTCGNQIVTNAPGQFAAPETQVVLDVCTDNPRDIGSTIVGLASQGVRVEIAPASADTADVVLLDRNGIRYVTTAPATVLRTDTQLSVSGRVSDGLSDLDLTIDIDASTASSGGRPCTADDQVDG